MRVVSLLPAATEMVAYLGATEHLVGISHECDFPPVVGSRARVTRSSLPHVGGAALQGADAQKQHDTGAPTDSIATASEVDAEVRQAADSGRSLFTLDVERIRALHPDVILTQALCDVCAVNEGDVRELAARLSPPPQIVTLGGTSIDGIMGDIRAVAEVLGVRDEADELIAGEYARLRTVHETLKAAAAPRPRVLLVEWSDPIFVAGHWGPEQIRRAGGVDVLGVAGEHSVTATHEACAAADPGIVIFAPCGFSLDAARREAEEALAMWPWLQGRQVWAMDANGLVSRPGPRVVDGVEAMARVFFPSGFTPVDHRHAVRVDRLR